MNKDGLLDFLNKQAGEIHRDIHTGKKCFKYGIAWIIVHQITPTLFMAVQDGENLPAHVKVIKADYKEFV